MDGKPRPGADFASSSPSLATAPSWCWHIYVILVRLRQEIAAVFSPASTHERAREKDDKMGRDRREQILRVCHSQTIICHKPVFWPRSKSHLVDCARSSQMDFCFLLSLCFVKLSTSCQNVKKLVKIINLRIAH